MLPAFALVALIGIATPGPTVLLALGNGSRFGMRRAMYGMAGAVISDFVLIAAVAAGLGALLAASQVLFAIVKWIGVAYLAFLGFKLLRTGQGSLGAIEGGGEGSPQSLFRKAFLVAVTNPKSYLFFTAFLPQFVTPDAPQMPQYAALAVVFASIDLAVMAGYALLGSRAVRLLKDSGTLWLDRVCGGAFLCLAASLALYRRRTA